MKQKLVVLTGAGISAESGIQTFRDAGGLWEGHNIEDVASPEGWQRNPELVLNFYNLRRDAGRMAEPNDGHKVLVELEEYFDVVIITQNIDNLHEKAGSSSVTHLHGEILKACSSSGDQRAVIDLGDRNIRPGDLCPYGTQLRPYIVWFGEAVPMMEIAIQESMSADIFLVVGTSLAVYPAAGLVQYTKANRKFIVDPNIPDGLDAYNFTGVQEVASSGMRRIKEILISEL